MPPASATAPIGVFDSGVGGLSVLREIHALLPRETLLYVADSGHAPYGEKSAAYIRDRSLRITQFLLDQGVKAVVVACNTVTGLTIDQLRAHFAGLIIVAIEPAVKPAVLSTRSGVVAVLATRQTVSSPGLARLVHLHGQGRRVILQACPGWVERVEAGELDARATEQAIRAVVEPLLAEGVDTLVLGCTHYPFLSDAIRRISGPDVQVLDPSAAVARELQRRLEANRLQATGPNLINDVRFWTSAEPETARPILVRLWGSAAPLDCLPV